MTDLSDYQQVLTPNYGVPPTIIVKGQGCNLFGQNGESYLDLAGGIAVSALGHCHPEVIKTLTDQANKIWHLSNVLANEPAIHLAKALVDATFADRVFFCNSGAEANEAAIKAARKAAFNIFGPDKSEIIAFNDAFHGRTIATITAGGQPKYRAGFGPMPAGFKHLPFNDCKAIKAQISEKTCAVMVEPVQGEGGVRPICPTFFEKIRTACNQVGAALIVDEVQTGMGRTGKLFAYQHSGVTPDILTSAKSLGCGFPIGAMLCKEWISEHFGPGTHGSTYGGNPLGTAVARKVLEIMKRDNCNKMAQLIEEQIRTSMAELPQVVSIRGNGAMLAIELDKAISKEVAAKASINGLLINPITPTALRLTPPLTTSEHQIQEGIQILKGILNAQASS